MPDKECFPNAMDIVMDTYGARGIKVMTQNCRGTTTRKIVVVVLANQCQNLAIGQHF